MHSWQNSDGSSDSDISTLTLIYNRLIQYADGDGDDVIEDYNVGDTLQVTDGVISSATANGSDIILNIGDGSIKLKDAAGKTITILESDGDVISTVVGSSSDDLEYVKLTNADKSPYTAASTVGTIDSSARTKAINITGNDNPNVFIGGKSAETFTGGAGNDTFVTSLGKDIVTDYSEGDVISLTGALTKTATNKNNDLTLTVGKGSINLKNAKGTKISLIDTEGNKLKQTFGVSSINIVDGDGSTINTAIDAAVITIDASTRTEDVVLIGNSKANTIIGGSGDDELTGGAGKDLFVYNGGDDIITDYKTGQDTIKLDGVTVNKAEYVGESNTDLKLTFVEGGSLIIENVVPIKSVKKVLTRQNPQKVNIIVDDVATSQIYNLSTISGGIDTVTGGTAVDSIYGFIGDEILFGGKGKDKFIYSSGNDTITDYTVKQDEIILNAGSADNYTVVGDDAIFTIDSSNSLTVQNVYNKTIKINGKDMLIVDPKRALLDDKTANPYVADEKVEKIDASKRKKAIEIIANDNDNTIIGGKGNDTLTGGDGADVFVYTTGNGNDTITDYSVYDGDIIQLGKKTAITGGATISGSDLILPIGKNKLTIKDGADKTITVVDDNGMEMTFKKRRTSTAFEERWFMENEEFTMQNAELDSIIDKDSNFISNDYDFDSTSIFTKKLNQTLLTNSTKKNK